MFPAENGELELSIFLAENGELELSICFAEKRELERRLSAEKMGSFWGPLGYTPGSVREFKI
jgi:hypothetical protein